MKIIYFHSLEEELIIAIISRAKHKPSSKVEWEVGSRTKGVEKSRGIKYIR